MCGACKGDMHTVFYSEYLKRKKPKGKYESRYEDSIKADRKVRENIFGES
jgi:hypothetical protein